MNTEFYEREDHPVWCSQCERWDEDCVCEELCDHFNSIEPVVRTGGAKPVQGERQHASLTVGVNPTDTDQFRESVGSAGDGDVCVPALSPVPLQNLGGDGVTRSLQTISPDREPASSDSAKAESNKQPVPSCSGTGTLLLDYPVWRMSFSAYGEHMGWEVPA